MAHMVLVEEELILPVEVGSERLQLAADDVLLEQFLAQPEWDRHCERLIAARRKPHIGLQEPLELEKRLLVEHDVVDVVERAAAFPQAIRNGMRREARVLLLAREALLLRGRHDAAIDEQRGGAVVIERRNAEDTHGLLNRAQN